MTSLSRGQSIRAASAFAFTSGFASGAHAAGRRHEGNGLSRRYLRRSDRGNAGPNLRGPNSAAL